MSTPSSSYSSSSATDVSTVSSSAELECALHALHKSYFQSIIHVQYFLSTLLSICVLFPHEVSKCSQLGLVLTFIEISVSHLTLSMSLCPSFKIALASRMTLRMSKCQSLSERMQRTGSGGSPLGD